MVLMYLGGGHDLEDKDSENWSFLDRKGKYFVCTGLLAKSEISTDEIAITRSIFYMICGDDIAPDAETIACVKEALQEWSRRYMFNLEHYKHCQLTLINARTKEQI